MKKSLIFTLIVCTAFIVTLFFGCTPDEPGVGNADIGYEGFKSDAELFYELVYRKESLILNALNYTSDGFTKAPFEGTVSEDEFGRFFAELEELNKEADEYIAAIQQLESSGVLQRPTQTRGIFSSAKEFFSWVSGAGERNRERITTIASNMTAAERSKLYNGMRDEWKNKSKNEADFWNKLQKGDYDSSAGQIYNDFYHDGETEFSDLAQEKGLTPQKIVVNEGAKGVESGANVVLDATSAVVPGFGTGTTVTKVADNVEKMTKSESWKEAAEHGFHAASDILEEVTGDIGYTGFNGSDVVNAIRNKVDETVFKKDDKEETKGKVSITDKNKEKTKSIVIVEKKGGATSSDGSPSIYTTTKTGISDGIDMLVKAGKWLVTVINEKGYRGTVEVEVEAGKVTVTEVNTQEPESDEEGPKGNYEFKYTIDNFQIEAEYLNDGGDILTGWMEYSEDWDGFEPLTYKDGYFVTTIHSVNFGGEENYKLQIDFKNKKLLLAEQINDCYAFTLKNLPVVSWSNEKMIFESSGEDLYDRFTYQNILGEGCYRMVGAAFESNSKARIEIRKR
ncbi:MAG: hypothetical protein PHS25_11105 [Proteiniphilum sp.]|jgi:hypothetical protein|nr:hypothetical protein [Proteiniphilum sp.]MDD2938823.1 hypothetical protein [Proteiniphilum sp.]MDD3074922.1 hypothetical protein [Proteiniphilum sp.]MDD4452866.1 hypothetical protein [Proteiniphilum sp.]